MSLESESYEAAVRVCQTLKDAGYTTYIVGGWVRDYLLGHPSSDIDIATSAAPNVVASLFVKTIPVGVQFASVVVVVGSQQFEVTTFRSESGYADGRHPDHVEFASPEEDAIRRDFTINGMFFDPTTQEVIDLVGGKEDLKQGIIRAIGVPEERFIEDRLRMLRGIRLSAHYGFSIDPATSLAIEHQAGHLFEAVAMERVWQEFNKMADHPYFAKALVEMQRLGLLPVIFPVLTGLPCSEIERRVAPINHFPKGRLTILKLAQLFPDALLEELVGIASYLRATGKDAKLLEYYCTHRSQALRPINDFEPAVWARFYAHPDGLICLGILAAQMPEEARKQMLQDHDANQKRLEWAVDRIRCKRPVINALRLAEEGIPSGPGMGILLKEAETISINEGIQNPDLVIDKLKHSSLWPIIRGS